MNAPLPKVIPGGEEPARDFAALTYPRPKGATPLRVALVPAFAACAAPNRTHGPPLAFGACAPPQPASDQLTVGTPDANGEAPGFTGSARLSVIVGNPQTPADEADVRLTISLRDVRRRADLADYQGELRWRSSLRVTDRANGPGADEAGTGQDTTFEVTVPCTGDRGCRDRRHLLLDDDLRRGRPGCDQRGEALDLATGRDRGGRRRPRRARRHRAESGVRAARPVHPVGGCQLRPREVARPTRRC